MLSKLRSQQDASFFVLRGEHLQIIGLDTAILDDFNLVSGSQHTLPFLPDDQIQWALSNIEVGANRGLKTIIMSHHQFFSRRESMGVPNSKVYEATTLPDRL